MDRAGPRPDNSPHALTRPANAGLYSARGLARAHAALVPIFVGIKPLR